MGDRSVNRRHFMVGAAAAATALASPRRALAESEKIVVGLMGSGGRGAYLAEYVAGRPDATVAYVCDADLNRAERLAGSIEKIAKRRPKVVQDFRKILDDKDVNVLFNATPDHWHAIPTVMACQAGKDVYVEKPSGQCVFEGQMMVKAARKHDRVVQLGTQTRSGAYSKSAKDYIDSGKLGKVHLVRVFNMKQMGGSAARPDGAAPEGVDYDLWLGPAPKRPFNPGYFHGTWYDKWDYCNGDVSNDGVHQVDIARYLIGRDYPQYAMATGGRHRFTDAGETPDTLMALFAFEGLTLSFEMALWTPYQVKTTGELRESVTEFPDWRYAGERVEIYGDKGYMMFGRHGAGWQAFGADGKQADQGNGPVPLAEHVDDFFACVKSRKRPNADIEEGHRSTLMCHLATISQKLGGRRLQLDAKTETIVGDAEAQAMMKRTYREPWTLKEEV